ncbi:uncharacterized protein TNCV_4640391 [Trichonephila clavipes]|nr:uncharacterized protein TNCV_4640391 [Trichonephila clavipes]
MTPRLNPVTLAPRVCDHIHLSTPTPILLIKYRVSGLRVSKSNGLLLRNYPSEYIKLFICGLETTSRFFGTSPIGRTCAHYWAIADDKLVTLTSLLKMGTPQQKVQSFRDRRHS